MPTILQSFGDALPARTCLAGSARVNPNNLTTGPFCLVREKIQKLRPSCIVNRLRQHSTGEAIHVQLFDGDQAKPIDNFARFLVMKIRALVGYMHVRPLKKLYGLAAAVTAFISPLNFALTAA